MELYLNNQKLYSEISQLTSPDLLYLKFSTDGYMTYVNCKSCFYYSFGHKIKKKDMKNILTHKINQINESVC